jgi:cell volume regulation protein A
VLFASAGLLAAILSYPVAERLRIPAPVLFLAAAAVASDLIGDLEGLLTPVEVGDIGTVALIVILFEGGMQVGWARFRASIWPIGLLGVPGTLATGAIVAAGAHLVLDLDWTTAAIIGAALAPTDPAVMFSVLGNREVGGRSGTILQGESGANDPVAIALIIGLLDFATDQGSGLAVTERFLLEMGVGLVVGVIGARLLAWTARRVPLAAGSFYPLQLLAAAGIVFGVAAVLHGSGFLAVFVAGILLGDERFPYKSETRGFLAPAAGLAEITVFVALGLTVDLGSFPSRTWVDGAVIAVVVVLIARPLVVSALLWRTDLNRAERLFISWAGMKGAVPILLGSYAVIAAVDHALLIYDVVFVVVTGTVLVQGLLLSPVARRLGIPMETVAQRPWSLAVVGGSYVVVDGSAAVGVALRDLPLGGDGWVSEIVRDGAEVGARGAQVLEAGDRVTVITTDDERERVRALLEGG